MALLSSRTAAASRRLRLSEYGWGQRAALIAVVLLGSAAFAYAADVARRHALWQVVRVCMFDKATTGSPFPCLEVDQADGAGFAVLRPPVGRPDTILAPTQRVIGLEDPQLQAADAPNYFALAWEARRWLKGAPADDRVALVVNSRLARTQDQLHVHIGCLTARFSARLRRGALGPASAEWFRSADIARGLEFWTYRAGARDWRTLAPFRLLQQLVGDPPAMKRTTLAVALLHGEFVVVAMRSRPGGWYADADDVIDGRC